MNIERTVLLLLLNVFCLWFIPPEESVSLQMLGGHQPCVWTLGICWTYELQFRDFSGLINVSKWQKLGPVPLQLWLRLVYSQRHLPQTLNLAAHDTTRGQETHLLWL